MTRKRTATISASDSTTTMVVHIQVFCQAADSKAMPDDKL